MGTGERKEETIKVRVSKEQKRLLKEVATSKGVTMSALLVGGTFDRIEKEKAMILEQEKLKQRIEDFESKIPMLKSKLKDRNIKNRRCFLWLKK